MLTSLHKYISLFIVLFSLTSCASYMHGYTQRKAENRYLLVDRNTESFGYKRMEYNLSYNDSLEGFVKNNGYPDFIYEYENEEGRDSIRMYYVKKDIVYIYESNSWVADSLYLKKFRPLTEYEKATYQELKKQKS